jgi:subtilase family serine protease
MRFRGALALLGAAAVGGSFVTSGGVAGATPSPSSVRLPDSTAAAVSGRTPTGTVSSTAQTTIQIWMRPDTAGATAYAQAVSTPGSAGFHHYLSPSAYTADFGPAASATGAVASWLGRQGFGHISVDAQRSYVRASATVGTAESAFAVRINRYQIHDPSGAARTVTANDRDITLPATLAKNVLGVTGLDNVAPQTFHAQTSVSRAAAAPALCSAYYGQKVKTGLPAYHGSTSFPYALCGYNGKQLRQAYGMNSTNTGKGQTVAFIEIGSPYEMEQTLTRWAKSGGLPAPKPTNYSELVLGRGGQCFNEFDIEEQLDIEAGYAMAPGSHQLLVGGDSCEEKLQGIQALFDAELAVLNGNGNAPLASLTSNSWGLTGGENFPSIYVSILHSILLRAAGEGVGTYFASGDDPGISVPADDPYATAVGGTSLGLDRSGRRLFETGWSNESLVVNTKKTGYIDEGIGRSAAGGGTSLLWKEPSYQKGVVPTSMTTPGAGNVSGLRAVPDIGALADAFTGISQAITEPGKHGDVYSVFPDGGTSLASPLVAGMVAAAQQGQSSTFGFINPLLYKLSATSALHDTLPVSASTPVAQRAVFCPANGQLCIENGLQTFDSQNRAYTDQITAKGFDTMSGIGTPNGQPFITALRRLSH